MSKFAAIATSVALIGALFFGAPAAVYAEVNDIYVGSNDSNIGGSCADPDFSTDVSDEGSINAALAAALAAIDDDADTVIICDGEYTYGADISLHDGSAEGFHDVINIAAAAGADVTLNGNGNYQLLSFEGVTSVSVTGIDFLGGQVVGNGAAIEVLGGTLSVIDSTFTANYATADGGAIYSEPGHVTISGSDFTNNEASDEGGAIAVEHPVDGEGVTVTDSNFTGNFQAEGAAISVNGDDSSAIITVTDSEFVNNDGEYGAITIDNGSVELTNVLMDGNNNSNGEGGAVWAGAGFTATDSEFTNNSSADDDGGAIYASGHLEVSGSQFSGNASGESYGGGAIQVEECDEVSVSGSTFRNNTAGDEGGGAINFDCDADADVLVSRNIFTGNSARRYGGAIDQEDDDFVIRYVRNTFTGNSVTDKTTGDLDERGGQGGAVWAYTATFSGNRFTRNRASEFGGAVYTPDRQVARSAKRSKFSGNRARRGPDVYLSRLGNGE